METLVTNCGKGFEHAYYRELATLIPANSGHIVRSPTGSWLAATASPLQTTAPSVRPTSLVNGTRVRSPTIENRPARQDKKRLSLAFFKGGSTSETPAEAKAEKQATEDQQLDAKSTTTSTSRSHSKDKSNRLSLSFLASSPSSPPIEALPPFPTHSQPSTQPSSSLQSRSQSVERRPETSKSGKSEKSGNDKKGSVRKRLSALNIGLGKKSSKNSVRGRFDDTLTEE